MAAETTARQAQAGKRLQWITVENPGEQVPIGQRDYVLESVFNPEYDSWEVLVLLEGESEEDEE